MRDHSKLRAFELADQRAIDTYGATRAFPSDERFGLVSQMRRAAVSVASNIVEGCAKNTQADYVKYLDIAFGSCREIGYQITLAKRLSFFRDDAAGEALLALANETSKVLGALIRSLRKG